MEPFTTDELDLIRDARFFRAKARISAKVRTMLEELHAGLQRELEQVSLLAPPGFDPSKYQLVKGEHLEDCPYQYLDFPKHFSGNEKFTFRSLFWWGHHVAFALILEGEGLLRYKQNVLTRYHQVAGRHLNLSLAPSLWEWKRGEGVTLELTAERRSQVAAVLSGRQSFKLARFVPHDDPDLLEHGLVELGRQALRSVLPVITP